MATQSKLKLEKYHYGVHVQRGDRLYGMSGKELFYGQWITTRTDQIIIVEMNEAIAQREAFFYRELNGHDHIICTFGHVENTLNSTIFVQEYAQQGDLANIFMDNQITISQTLLIEIFSQVTDAMSYVASKSIVHGDLGCRNILVCRIDSSETKNTLVKLTDFGLACSSDCAASINETTPIIPFRYCAPEILRDEHPSNYSEKSDVYSMGVLMWEALSKGEIPYSSLFDDLIVKQMKLIDEKLIRPLGCDPQLWILMEQCWSFEPKHRINFEQIKDYLSEINISELTDIQLSIPSYESPIPCEFKINLDIEMNGPLTGSYGQTYEAQWLSREERPIVLIKIDKQPTEYELLFYTEFKSHPHIIHTFGFVENDLPSILLLQERASHGNLQVLLEKNQFQPSIKVLVEIFCQIIDAMIYITKKNVVHGDLRCANVLVFEMSESKPRENLVKLTNFTSAHRNDPSFIEDRRSMIPVRYCAPEILRSAGRSNYSELSDVYSMGVLMWEACSHGQLPYNSLILNSEIRQRKLNGEKLSKPWLCNNQIWSIMEDCWHNEPQLRYNFEEMKIRLSSINLQSDNTYQYEMNVDVKKGNQLNGKFGKRFYEAEWIPKKEPSIILIIMDEETAKHEVPFYMQLTSHEHIIHTFGLVKNDPRSTTIAQERAPHGNLQILLQNKQFKPSGNVLVGIFLQIVDAMIYITKRNIVHGDLRCENVLIFKMSSLKPEENLIKLTNFNLSRHNDSSFIDKRQTMIPVRYCAPELLQNSKPSNSCELSDVYSMGVLMWEACSKGNIPYGSTKNDDDIRQARLNNEKLSQPNECYNQIWVIIQDCWHSEPELRYNFRDMQTRLSNIYTTCSHCRNQYLTDDMPIHRKSCPPKSNPIPSRPPSIQRPHFPSDRKDNYRVKQERSYRSEPPSPKTPSLEQETTSSVNNVLKRTTSLKSVSSSTSSRFRFGRIRSFFQSIFRNK